MSEVAWLIEWPIGEPYPVPNYWGKTIAGVGRTDEPNDAIRFARCEDAETVIRAFEWKAVAREHMWSSQ